MGERRIGIVGGGQLGRMLTEAAKPMGFEVSVVDPSTYSCPAAQAGAEQIRADLDDPHAISWLVSISDVTTWEIEHINPQVLMELAQEGYDIQPSPYDLRTIQDKLEQKQWLRRQGIPLGDFFPVSSAVSLTHAIETFGTTVVKTRRGGYDGRGNLVLSAPDWETAKAKFGTNQLYAERELDLQKELSVIVARDTSGRIAIYPTIETVQQDGQCSIAVAPARIEARKDAEAREIALETLKHLGGCGVFAFEMFLTKDDQVLMNEIAPRVHNSGHLTMEASVTSQFEQHIRAVAGLPLGRTELTSPAAMINILGERDGPVELSGLDVVLAHPNAHVHIYGKEPTKISRKMGHITVLAETTTAAARAAAKLRREISI